MKTLTLLFLTLIATTALTAQSTAISYNNVTVDTYYNGTIVSTQTIADNVTATFDFEKGEVTIQGEKGIIYLVKASKVGDGEDGVQRFKGYIQSFEIEGTYDDTKTRVIINNKVYTFANKSLENKT